MGVQKIKSTRGFANYAGINYVYHGPSKPTCLEVFMVINLVFRWPKPFFFHGFGGLWHMGMYHVSSALWNHFLRPDPSWCVMGRILHHALRIDAIAASKLKAPSRNSLEFARQLGPIVDSCWPGWGGGWLYCISDVEAWPFFSCICIDVCV